MLRISTGRLYPRSSFARLGKSCQNVPAHFDDFPPQGVARGYFEVIKAARRGANASAGRAHPSGDLLAASTLFSVSRAYAIQLYSAIAEIVESLL